MNESRSKTEKHSGIYRSAGWIRNNVGVAETRLLRLVALRLVRVRASSAVSPPTYSVDDVNAHISIKESTHASEKTAAKRSKAPAAEPKRATPPASNGNGHRRKK
jgi:hypothetical protein